MATADADLGAGLATAIDEQMSLQPAFQRFEHETQGFEVKSPINYSVLFVDAAQGDMPDEL